jgi:hypothetical protein
MVRRVRRGKVIMAMSFTVHRRSGLRDIPDSYPDSALKRPGPLRPVRCPQIVLGML